MNSKKNLNMKDTKIKIIPKSEGILNKRTKIEITIEITVRITKKLPFNNSFKFLKFSLNFEFLHILLTSKYDL